LKEGERERKREGVSGRKRKKDRGFWAKRLFLPPPIQNRGGPTGRPAWGSPAVLPTLAAAQERGKKGEGRGDPAPALTSSSGGPWMALCGGAVVERCGGGGLRRWRLGGAVGAEQLAWRGVGSRGGWRRPFIGPEGRFRGKIFPTTLVAIPARWVVAAGEVNRGAIGCDWSVSDAVVAGDGRGGVVRWMRWFGGRSSLVRGGVARLGLLPVARGRLACGAGDPVGQARARGDVWGRVLCRPGSQTRLGGSGARGRWAPVAAG
jgi:hypothetical protein